MIRDREGIDADPAIAWAALDALWTLFDRVNSERGRVQVLSVIRATARIYLETLVCRGDQLAVRPSAAIREATALARMRFDCNCDPPAARARTRDRALALIHAAQQGYARGPSLSAGTISPDTDRSLSTR